VCDLSDSSRFPAIFEDSSSNGGPEEYRMHLLGNTSGFSESIPTIFEDNSSTGHEQNRFHSSMESSSAWSEMTFQSDAQRFPAGAPVRKLENTLIEAQFDENDENSEDSNELNPTENAATSPSNDGHDPFDDIMFRETPGRNAAFDQIYAKEESPAGVMDLVLCGFQTGSKDDTNADNLAFVDEEYDGGDPLFTDKEDSFEGPDSPLTKPMFLTVSRFEI
jgi:hypothetical protein